LWRFWKDWLSYCIKCSGTATIPGTGKITCPTCGGSKKMSCPGCGWDGKIDPGDSDKFN